MSWMPDFSVDLMKTRIFRSAISEEKFGKEKDATCPYVCKTPKFTKGLAHIVQIVAFRQPEASSNLLKLTKMLWKLQLYLIAKAVTAEPQCMN